MELRQTRTHPTKIHVGIWGWRESDAGWETPDGYEVHRTYDYGAEHYWVPSKDGRCAMHTSLEDAYRDIEFLRKREQ